MRDRATLWEIDPACVMKPSKNLWPWQGLENFQTAEHVEGGVLKEDVEVHAPF